MPNSRRPFPKITQAFRSFGTPVGLIFFDWEGRLSLSPRLNSQGGTRDEAEEDSDARAVELLGNRFVFEAAITI
jgi:hypothetical protein